MTTAWSLTVATTPLHVCHVALPRKLARRIADGETGGARATGGGGVALKLEWASDPTEVTLARNGNVGAPTTIDLRIFRTVAWAPRR